MWKKLVIALAIGLLEFKPSLGEGGEGETREVFGQTIEFKPYMDLVKMKLYATGKFQLLDSLDKAFFKKDMVFHYRYHPDEEEYDNERQDPLRRVTDIVEEGGIAYILFDKLGVKVNVGNAELVVGSCVAQQWDDWTLRVPDTEEIAKEFPKGKIVESLPQEFKFKRWEKLRDVIVDKKVVKTGPKTTALHVELTSCKRLTVYKNGCLEKPYQACHISKDTTMVFIDANALANFTTGDYFQYKSNEEPESKQPRDLNENPVRMVKKEDAKIPNSFIIEKIKVELSGKGVKGVPGILFSENKQTGRWIVEVENKPQDKGQAKIDYSTIFTLFSQIAVNWTCGGENRNGDYNVVGFTRIPENEFTRAKDGYRFTLKKGD